MNPASPSLEVANATRAAVLLAGAMGVLLCVATGWQAGIGVIVGAGVMTGTLRLAAWRASGALRRRGRGRLLRWLLVAAQLLKFVAILVVFWFVVYVLGAPGWSLAAGITLGVIALVVGFAMPLPLRS